MEYSPTLTSAMEFSKAGKLEEWIHIYLLSDGHNKAFSDGLKKFDRFLLGPFKMPLSLFERCCGPEENMTYRVDADWFEEYVTGLEKKIESGEDIPPMTANYVDGHFELNDGNHRFEAYTRKGVKEGYFIIWITEKEDYDEFVSKYSQYLN